MEEATMPLCRFRQQHHLASVRHFLLDAIAPQVPDWLQKERSFSFFWLFWQNRSARCMMIGYIAFLLPFSFYSLLWDFEFLFYKEYERI
jgi:hypothetical protein